MFKPVSSTEDGWWNNSDSSSDSSYSSSHSNNSSCPDWEEEITPQGELFYVVKYPKPSHNVAKSDQEVSTAMPVSTNKKEPNDKPSILVKLMRRKSSKRTVRRIEETSSGLTQSTPSLTKEGDVYNIQVGVSGVTGWPKPNQSMLEARLGLIAETHKNKLIIQAFSPDMMSFYQPTVSIGDWLCCVDSIAVNPDNIDSVLESIITPKDVILKIKSMKNKKPNGSFLRKKGVLLGSQRQARGGANTGWLMYISAGCSEGNITYRFPPRPSTATPSPGAFLTLSHILTTLTSSSPLSSSLCINNQLVNVIYTVEGNDVLLVCLPIDKVSLSEAMRLNSELVRCLKFNFQSLARCFSSKEVNKVSVDEMISNFFRRTTLSGNGSEPTEDYHFDSLLPGAHSVPLPKKIQVQMGDALNELESNDIKEYEGKRLYSVAGTCLIHKGYVLRNQTRDIEDIYSLLKGCHLLDLMREGIQDMVIWREVFPTSYREATVGNEPYSLQPNIRTFLLAVAQEHDMLIILYESGGCTLRLKGNPGPDAVYVEEAQATLEHIQALGFAKYVTKWFEMNENLRSLERSKSTDSQLSDSKGSARSVRMADPQRFSFEYPPLSGFEGGVRVRSWSLPSVNAQSLSGRLSADKISCTSAEQQSISLKSESDLSEDTETRDQRSLDSGSLCEWNDFGKNLLQEPGSLPLARNGRLLQWIQLDQSNGLIVSSMDSILSLDSVLLSSHYQSVMNTFRKLSHQIHQVLNSPASFKTPLKNEDSPTNYSNLNKSVLALNEHGLLFEVPLTEDNRKSSQIYWAVGRLLFTPQPREVYVCYEDSCPQNLVEIAFRIALNTYL